jgi:quinoprotein glucose dehydrogenase
MRSLLTSAVGLFALLVSWSLATPAAAQTGTDGAQWAHYGGDLGSTKYVPLEQIHKDNFPQLEILWRWESADKDLVGKTPFKPYDFRGAPLYVNGTVYMVTGLCQVAAIDASSGEARWVYDPESYKKGRITHTLFQHRGLEYWTDGTQQRLLLATGGRQLVSIDAKTGRPDPSFGVHGMVDLTQDLGRKVNPRDISHTAPVLVCRDTVIVGSIVNDFGSTKEAPPGHIRGYDVRTGQLRWRFNSIPQSGEFGNETWLNHSWKYTGNTNVWTMMSADDELGYVYLPFGTPTSDYYGGHRPGDNLFGECLVCLDAKTGERIWHFQAVHHGIWDYDFPSAPNLIDITVAGTKIKAVAQVSKQGFTYVFDRVTGKPVWPIEERPVAASVVPDEKTSSTQPFPTKPPAFERQGVSVDDLIDFTPELRAEAKKILAQYVSGPLFTPLTLFDKEGTKGTLVVPGAEGGANWPGASIDPESGILYVASVTRPSVMSLIKPNSPAANLNYLNNWGGGTFTDRGGPQGLPLLKPPYRRITAIDLNRGEHLWQIPFGEGPTQHPAIKHLKLGPLGTQFQKGVLAEGGILVTKTLLITFLPVVDEMGDRAAHGSLLQAYDKATGALLHSKKIERTLHGGPISYLHGDKQYILIAAGGRHEPAELLAFGLPTSKL